MNETDLTDKPARRLWILHSTSWCVGACVLAALFVVNIDGAVTTFEVDLRLNTVMRPKNVANYWSHGWPFPFLARSKSQFDRSSFQTEHFDRWSIDDAPLRYYDVSHGLADAGIALFLILGCIAAVESACRRGLCPTRVSLRAIFAFIGFIAMTIAVLSNSGDPGQFLSDLCSGIVFLSMALCWLGLVELFCTALNAVLSRK